ncbi:helix-turn-helix domain-containing protein [Macrococcoides caseolyticum]|uniref:helix-turn-helix domain-containing protein n=1 Tax=Macrococcoides caseolyticum TaxID=69966 RepID=UPI000C31EAEB|nr:helix-turn-helix transcriptional regulator [Macrococcus caseolyticus]PKF08353.1 hypothetical protein CW698_01045 [Macrococcus caseolyticus]
MDMKDNLSKNLKLLMEQSKTTQIAIVEKTGLNRPTLKLILDNKHQNIKFSTIEGIANYFHIRPIMLFEELKVIEVNGKKQIITVGQYEEIELYLHRIQLSSEVKHD